MNRTQKEKAGGNPKKKSTRGVKNSKLLRYSFRHKKRVTSIAVKSYIVSLYLTMNNVKTDHRDFMREAIGSILKDLHYNKSNKGLSEDVSIRLLDSLLEKKDKKIFYKHLVRLFDED